MELAALCASLSDASQTAASATDDVSERQRSTWVSKGAASVTPEREESYYLANNCLDAADGYKPVTKCLQDSSRRFDNIPDLIDESVVWFDVVTNELLDRTFKLPPKPNSLLPIRRQSPGQLKLGQIPPEIRVFLPQCCNDFSERPRIAQT